MVEPDLDLARRFVAANPPPGELALVALTGAHLYGFPSVDSDLDLKGVHLAPRARLLGLFPPPETHDRLAVFEGVECDLTTHEAAKALGLLLKGNGNVLEQITSPHQVISPDAEALQALVPAALSKRVYGHYAGYFKGMQREHRSRMRLKSLLYSFRVALTGEHLLRTGEVVAHLPTLAHAYDLPELDGLIARKRAEEKGALDAEESARFERLWPAREAALAEARTVSVLPDEPDPRPLDAWLVARRSA